MKEESLARSVNNLAQKQAEDLLDNLRKAVIKAIQPYARHPDANNDFHPEDLKNVIIEYAQQIGAYSSDYRVKPSEALVNSCRAQVLKNLMGGLPQLAKLARMAEEQQQDDIDPDH
mgnify:CR=1 FL=1